MRHAPRGNGLSPAYRVVDDVVLEELMQLIVSLILHQHADQQLEDVVLRSATTPGASVSKKAGVVSRMARTR